MTTSLAAKYANCRYSHEAARRASKFSARSGVGDTVR